MLGQRVAVCLFALAATVHGVSLRSADADREQVLTFLRNVLQVRGLQAAGDNPAPATTGNCSPEDHKSIVSVISTLIGGQKSQEQAAEKTAGQAAGQAGESAGNAACDQKTLFKNMALDYDALSKCLEASGVSATCSHCPVDFLKGVVGTSMNDLKCVFPCMGLATCKDADTCRTPTTSCVGCMKVPFSELGYCTSGRDKKEITTKIDGALESVQKGSDPNVVIPGIWNELFPATTK